MKKLTVQGREWLRPAGPSPESFGTGHSLVGALNGPLLGDDYPSEIYKSDEEPASAGSRHRSGG